MAKECGERVTGVVRETKRMLAKRLLGEQLWVKVSIYSNSEPYDFQCSLSMELGRSETHVIEIKRSPQDETRS